MQVDCLVLGDFQTNCYVLRSSDQVRPCLLIDPALGVEPLLDFLADKSLEPGHILLTHGHCDHIGGLDELRQKYGPVRTSIDAADADMLTSCRKNLSLLMGMALKFDPADDELTDGQVIEFDGLSLEVLSTPGHTPGGVSFYCAAEATVFSGDALFAGGIGRTDFPGGSADVLLESIRGRLFGLPDRTKVYPGHGPATTIEAEKRTNPFCRQA